MQSFQILDAEDQQRLIRKMLKAQELDEAIWVPRELQWFINHHKDEGKRPKDLKDGGDPTLRMKIKLYGDYEAVCERAGVIDFAEMLLRAYELWRDNPQILAHYRQRFQHILVDEFQDTNEIQYKWLKLLAGDTGMPFVVGDDDQCLPSGTPVTMGDGSVKGIEAILPGEQVMSSYGSGEFRGAEVMQRFVRERRGRLIRLHLRCGKVIASTPEHTHFAGFLPGESPQTCFLYLLRRARGDYRLGTGPLYGERLTGGFGERIAQEPGIATWIVRTHPNESEARLDAILTASRYGLPTAPFEPPNGIGLHGVALDTVAAAERLLEASGLDPDRPHHTSSSNSNHRQILLTLCSERHGARPVHRISIDGVDECDRPVLEALGLSVCPAHCAAERQRFETVREDFAELMTIARRIREQLDHARYVLQGQILGRPLPFVTAASIRLGMAMATESSGYGTVERIEHEDFDGEIYDLNVARTHNLRTTKSVGVRDAG